MSNMIKWIEKKLRDEDSKKKCKECKKPIKPCFTFCSEYCYKEYKKREVKTK